MICSWNYDQRNLAFRRRHDNRKIDLGSSLPDDGSRDGCKDRMCRQLMKRCTCHCPTTRPHCLGQIDSLVRIGTLRACGARPDSSGCLLDITRGPLKESEQDYTAAPGSKLVELSPRGGPNSTKNTRNIGQSPTGSPNSRSEDATWASLGTVNAVMA